MHSRFYIKTSYLPVITHFDPWFRYSPTPISRLCPACKFDFFSFCHDDEKKKRKKNRKMIFRRELWRVVRSSFSALVETGVGRFFYGAGDTRLIPCKIPDGARVLRRRRSVNLSWEGRTEYLLCYSSVRVSGVWVYGFSYAWVLVQQLGHRPYGHSICPYRNRNRRPISYFDTIRSRSRCPSRSLRKTKGSFSVRLN